jgi:hypothetical protein
MGLRGVGANPAPNRHKLKRRARQRHPPLSVLPDGLEPIEITKEMLRLFMRRQELEPIRYGCLSETIVCKSADGHHCPECAECVAVTGKLRELTGAKMWEPSGTGADGPDPPACLAANPRARTEWRRAWRLHCTLYEMAEAAREQEVAP